MPENRETAEATKERVEEIYDMVEKRSKERAKARFRDMLRVLGTAVTEASAIAVIVFFLGFFLDSACS